MPHIFLLFSSSLRNPFSTLLAPLFPAFGSQSASFSIRIILFVSMTVFSRVLRDSISHFSVCPSVRPSVGRSQNCFKGFLNKIKPFVMFLNVFKPFLNLCKPLFGWSVGPLVRLSFRHKLVKRIFQQTLRHF